MTNEEAIETLRANYPDVCFGQLREAVDMAISALTAQESCNQLATDLQPSKQDADDLISRQAAISHVDDVPYIKEHPNVGLLWKAWIESLPSAQHWIPCSKALPKIGNRVIGTYKNSLFKNGPYVVRIMCREKKYWVGDDEHWFLYENILAWQPLPDPYHKQGGTV